MHGISRNMESVSNRAHWSCSTFHIRPDRTPSTLNISSAVAHATWIVKCQPKIVNTGSTEIANYGLHTSHRTEGKMGGKAFSLARVYRWIYQIYQISWLSHIGKQQLISWRKWTGRCELWWKQAGGGRTFSTVLVVSMENSRRRCLKWDKKEERKGKKRICRQSISFCFSVLL